MTGDNTAHQVINPEIKANWIEALRSGRYKQGQNHLRSKDGCFCCLGVLCEVLGVQPTLDGDYYLYEGLYGALSANLKQRVGFEPGSGVPSSLAYMNDHGKSFAEIADHIEANL